MSHAKDSIDSEYKKTKIGRQYFESLHQRDAKKIKSALKSRVPSSEITIEYTSLPPQVEQQFRITQLQSLTSAEPHKIDGWVGLAEIFYELNELDKSLAAINRAWSLDRNNPRVIHSKACILAEYAMAKNGAKSMLHEAIALFELMRTEVSLAGMIDYNIGNCYVGLDDHIKAIEYYDKALDVNPKPDLASQIWKNRGTSFGHLGNYDEEIRSYKESVRANPRQWKAYSSWAATELGRKNYENAKKLFIRTLQVKPELEEGEGYPQLYSLAYCLWQLNELFGAYQRVNQVLSIKPEHLDAKLLKVHLLSELWRIDSKYIPSAISFFKSRILDDPEDMFSRSELYLLYNSEGNKEEANVILKKTVDFDTAPSQALYDYAMLLETEQRVPEAIQFLEAAFKQSQQHHIVHQLARLKEKMGDYR